MTKRTRVLARYNNVICVDFRPIDIDRRRPSKAPTPIRQVFRDILWAFDHPTSTQVDEAVRRYNAETRDEDPRG